MLRPRVIIFMAWMFSNLAWQMRNLTISKPSDKAHISDNESVLSATKFSAPWGSSCHNNCVLEGLCMQQESLSKTVVLRTAHSYGWRWENLETFLYTSWLVLVYPPLYNSSFGQGNSRLDTKEDLIVQVNQDSHVS